MLIVITWVRFTSSSPFLFVKKIIYSELAEYCKRNTFPEEEIFVRKCKEIDDIECFINEHSFSCYYEQVKAYFSDVPKLFWWQDAVSLSKCSGTIKL